jgi:hypothetical protein
LKKEYFPPNFVNSIGEDNYQKITGVKSTPEEVHYKNPVVYARAKYAQYLANIKVQRTKR